MQFSIFHSIAESNINSLVQLLNDGLKPKEHYKLISVDDLPENLVLLTASEALFKIDGNKLFERTRELPYANIRPLIYTYLHNELKWKHQDIGEFFNRDRTTITIHIQKFKKTMEIYKEDRLNYGRFAIMVSDRGAFDKELLSEFIKENGKFLSDDLKQYLSVRL